jgi:hypothetical protein
METAADHRSRADRALEECRKEKEEADDKVIKQTAVFHEAKVRKRDQN